VNPVRGQANLTLNKVIPGSRIYSE
jgi:hypothetical protein